MERSMEGRRKQDELKQKAENIREMLGLEGTPVHLMAWQERRFDLPISGECLPIIDVIENMCLKISALAKMVDELAKSQSQSKRPGRPKKTDKAK